MTIDDRELDRRLAALTREIDVDESLWPGIERRLGAARRWPAAAAAVASITAVAIAGVFIAMPTIDRGAIEGPGVAQREAEAMRALTPEASAVSQIDASPALQQAWQENQTAIEQLEQALEADPDNRMLLEFLSEARLRQAQLIQRGMSLSERSI